MPLRVIRFDDVDSFLERAEGWLRQAEAENNLILGVAHQVRRGDHPFEEPIYLAAVVENESIVTCAFRTPPFKLGLTRAPESAIPRLVRDVREVYGSLPGVLGPEPAAVQFAELWTLEFGGEWERGMRQGIYAPRGGHLSEQAGARRSSTRYGCGPAIGARLGRGVHTFCGGAGGEPRAIDPNSRALGVDVLLGGRRASVDGGRHR